MNLINLFLLTESILAILLCVFMFGLLIALYSLVRAIKEVKERMIYATEEVINSAEETKNMASKITKSFTDYITIKIVNSLNKKGERRR